MASFHTAYVSSFRVEAACLCQVWVFLTMLKVGRLIWPEIHNQLWIANNILRPFMYAPTSLLLRNYDAEHNRLHIRIT